MRRLQNGLPEALPPSEIEELLCQHLPYRIRLVQNAIGRIPAKTMEDNQAFEAGAVAGRSLLSFLGISYDRRTTSLKLDQTYQKEKDEQTDEIKISDVGGAFVDIDTLSTEQKELIARFIHGVHKFCAHFTWKSTHTLDVPTYQAGAELIVNLYHTHIKKVEQGGAVNAATRRD